MTMPAERLLWGRGLTDAEQVRQAEISLLVPAPLFRQVLDVEPAEARWAEWEAIVRSYAPAWEDERARRDQEARYVIHMGHHYRCPGMHKCEEFNGARKDDASTVCPHCGYACASSRSLRAHVKRHHETAS